METFMKIVLQRVKKASVKVDEKIVGNIGSGYVLFIGITHDDTKETAKILAEKISKIRLFSDEDGKMNLSAKDVNGEVLAISQFTLYADCKKGNRPNFLNAAPPNIANEIYEYFVSLLEGLFSKTQKGIFGADMKVELINDGPVTIILEA